MKDVGAYFGGWLQTEEFRRWKCRRRTMIRVGARARASVDSLNSAAQNFGKSDQMLITIRRCEFRCIFSAPFNDLCAPGSFIYCKWRTRDLSNG